MTKQKTQENNKLIAEFMAVDRSSNLPDGSLSFDNLPISYIIPESMEKGYYGNWNSDWALLMGVVEKIQMLDMVLDFVIASNWIEVEGKQVYYYQEYIYKGEKLKEAVYKAVVEFIKWYNKQNEL